LKTNPQLYLLFTITPLQQQNIKTFGKSWTKIMYQNFTKYQNK